MPNPFIELPLSNELFNRQQDSTVPPEENLDSSWEFNLDNEYTGNRGSAYQILGGLYQNTTEAGTAVFVATYGRLIEVQIPNSYVTQELTQGTVLEGVKWRVSTPGLSGDPYNDNNGFYTQLQEDTGFGGGSGQTDPTTFSIRLADIDSINTNLEQTLAIRAYALVIPQEGTPDPYYIYLPEMEFTVIPNPSPDPNQPTLIPQYIPFVANIASVDDDIITINQSWNSFLEKVGDVEQQVLDPTSQFTNWSISYKINDKRDLNTYLHLGDDKLQLITNVKTDHETFPDLPYSAIFKLYEPLSDDIEEKDNAYIVREILPQHTQTVELIPYEQEEDVLVLKIPDTPPDASPITKREVELKSYNDLITTDGRLQKEIVDKYISGSEKPVDLSVEYSQYENFINFSSAEKRLENFKYKIEQIEEYTSLSSSFAATTNGKSDAEKYDDQIRFVKNSFDGYEDYLYNTKSTYKSSSMGEFPNASWPKAGSGTYLDPFIPVSSSHADFISWYGSVSNSTGQIYSASLYDRSNPNRLVNLLPEHINSDVGNSQFLDFMDMVGQHFDELWSYIKALSEITDRQSDLEKGFSKDLIYNLAKSLGWDSNDGKDLLDLSQVGFGQKLEGDSYSLYTSGSLSSPPEGDVSKEIMKRLIASMPYLLKAKGTIGSLKGLLNCYGIPSSILRVREYGGLQEPKQREAFEISRKFTKALGFRGGQYVSSSWANDTTSGRKPETVEMRFRSVSGSDQVLVQKDDGWAIKLKDNNSADNYGTVAFVLSGSDGFKTVSSSALPIFDGDYYSVMLQKTKVNTELFPHPSFDADTLFNPPFLTQSFSDNAVNGALEIVSSSNVARTGTKSLRHINTSDTQPSHTLFFNNPHVAYGSSTASVTSATLGQTFTLSAYAKVSASVVDSIGRLKIFELDSNEEMVNVDEDPDKAPASGIQALNSIGGVKTSENVGLDESEWRQISVTKTIRYPNTAKLGVRFENLKPNSTIYWDDVSLRKGSNNTDSINDAFNYNLFVKKYESGLDRILYSARTNLTITGSNTVTQSYNASWTGSGGLFIGGKPSSAFGNQLTGSIMEFRLWNEPLLEKYFDIHVMNPKSYVGNTPSSSYYSLVRRYSFDDNTILSGGSTIRDVSSNQTDTVTGAAVGFGGVNTFESVEDKTKTMVPNYGPNRRSATKIRIENNALSGSGANLSINERFDVSSNDFAPLDSPKVGIYFSPTDVVNEDIILSFANLDFNQYLGDPRDNFELHYPELRDIANEYFQKYSGRNDFWDYMRLIKYYDQSVFKQVKKLIPARSKPHLGTVIEPNIFERSKSPVQRNNPSFTLPYYDAKLNLTNFHYNIDANQEASHSVVKIEGEYPVYEGEIDKSVRSFELPSLYKFDFNDNFDDRSLYVSASATYGGPSSVYQEPTGSIILNNRLSELNQQYKFFYTSSVEFDNSQKYSLDNFVHFYSSRSLHPTDLDTEYQNTTAFRRMCFEGVKNTKSTTLDGDYPVIIRTTSPTIAVPTNAADSNLKVVDDKL